MSFTLRHTVSIRNLQSRLTLQHLAGRALGLQNGCPMIRNTLQIGARESDPSVRLIAQDFTRTRVSVYPGEEARLRAQLRVPHRFRIRPAVSRCGSKPARPKI